MFRRSTHRWFFITSSYLPSGFLSFLQSPEVVITINRGPLSKLSRNCRYRLKTQLSLKAVNNHQLSILCFSLGRLGSPSCEGFLLVGNCGEVSTAECLGEVFCLKASQTALSRCRLTIFSSTARLPIPFGAISSNSAGLLGVFQGP